MDIGELSLLLSLSSSPLLPTQGSVDSSQITPSMLETAVQNEEQTMSCASVLCSPLHLPPFVDGSPFLLHSLLPVYMVFAIAALPSSRRCGGPWMEQTTTLPSNRTEPAVVLTDCEMERTAVGDADERGC